MIANAINLQLVPRLLGPTQTAGGRIYVAFDLSASQWDSIKEQTTVLAEATGGPQADAQRIPRDRRPAPGRRWRRALLARSTPPAGGAA
jgi:hypothetical protein